VYLERICANWGGYPLIAYSIASAKASKYIDKIILSTDDAKIARVGEQFGAEVPFLRPADLATDSSRDFDLVLHALQWLKEHQSYSPDIVVQLRPTSPFRPKGLLDHAVELLASRPELDAVRGVTSPRDNPFKMWKRQEGVPLESLIETTFDEAFNMPRQELPPVWYQTGHVDAFWAKTVLEKRSLSGESLFPVEVDPKFLVDIDRIIDFRWAEFALTGGMRDEIDLPGSPLSFSNQPFLVLDFDGVFTDNKVYLNQEGQESVRCDRGDGLGLELLQQMGVPVCVISKEKNSVVETRCKKLSLEVHQGVDDKLSLLKSLMAEKKIDQQDLVYVGNDTNDLACLEYASIGVAVKDSHPEVLKRAQWVLARNGGEGAIREVCDLIVDHLKAKG